MKPVLTWLLTIFGSSVWVAATQAGTPPLRTDNLTTRLIAEQTAVVPGQTLRLGLWLQHDDEWHTYWLNPGDSGLPTRIELDLPPGFTAGSIRWPIPKRLPVGPLVNFGYDGTIVLPLDVAVPPDWVAEELVIEARADWLICRIECVPGEGRYTLHLPVASTADVDPRWAEAFADAERRQPRLASATTVLRVTADAVELPLPGELSHGLDLTWTYFPATPDVTSNSVEPLWTLAGDHTVLVLPKNEYFAQAPAEFVFLLARGDTGLLIRAVTDDASGTLPATGAFTAGRLLTIVGLALLGGLLLNLMPCVFPVLFLKAAGAMESAGDPARLRHHGLLYTAGVITSFLLVASLLLALRASGEALGWGFQLQTPAFVAALALLFFVLAMNFAGLFEFGGRLAGVGEQLVRGRGGWASFLTGVLACLVASPCTAPFMGVALGAALTLPALPALTVFAALGLGLALPILALGWVPGLARRLPRPGAWMETFRHFLAFPLLLTVTWLLWVYGEQTSVLAMSWLLVALLGVAFGFWLRRAGGRWRAVAWIVLLLSVALPLWPGSEPGQPTRSTASAAHEAWTPERLAAARNTGAPVLVNMTAAWCITCLANERVALSSPLVAGALERKGIRYLKGDWTLRDSEITTYLESFGRSGVPLYVLYPGPGREPVVLPQILTVETVLRALDAI